MEEWCIQVEAAASRGAQCSGREADGRNRPPDRGFVMAEVVDGEGRLVPDAVVRVGWGEA